MRAKLSKNTLQVQMQGFEEESKLHVPVSASINNICQKNFSIVVLIFLEGYENAETLVFAGTARVLLPCT